MKKTETPKSRDLVKRDRSSQLAESLAHFAPERRPRPEILTKRIAERFPSYGIVAARHAVTADILTPQFGPAGGDAGPGTTFVDGAGPVLANVHVFLIFWGKAWNNSPVPTPDQITNAVISILDGPYMSRLQQYRIAGNGTLIGTTLVTTSDPPQNFSDQNVANLVTSLIGSAGFPDFRTDDQLLYCVIMPKGITPGGKSFIGEHFGFTFKGNSGQIAWVTNDGTLGYLTSIFSHELVEACTDPQGTAWQGVAGTCNQTGWCEIADVCTSTDTVGGVLVQSYWSNQDNSCIIPKGIVPGAVSGNPVLIQGNLGGGRGNFEMVVPGADIGMVHYSRDNNAPFVPWSPPKNFGTTLGRVDGLSMIEYSARTLIVVARTQGRTLGFHPRLGPHLYLV
jgi:hypothetical protein